MPLHVLNKKQAESQGAPAPNAKRRARSILSLTLDGREREGLVSDGMLLLDYPREQRALIGT